MANLSKGIKAQNHTHEDVHTSHSHTWGDESGTLARSLGARISLFAGRELCCSQSRNSLMGSDGKACRHALIHMGERGIIRITQPFIDGRQLAS